MQLFLWRPPEDYVAPDQQAHGSNNDVRALLQWRARYRCWHSSQYLLGFDILRNEEKPDWGEWSNSENGLEPQQHSIQQRCVLPHILCLGWGCFRTYILGLALHSTSLLGILADRTRCDTWSLGGRMCIPRACALKRSWCQWTCWCRCEEHRKDKGPVCRDSGCRWQETCVQDDLMNRALSK